MEVMYDLLIQGEGKELFYQPLGGYHTMTLEPHKNYWNIQMYYLD